MLMDRQETGIPFHRWEEFQDRLTSLNNGEFKPHGTTKLKHWLRVNGYQCIQNANQLHKANDGAFIKCVADAEKCFSLLHLMESGQIQLNETEPGDHE